VAVRLHVVHLRPQYPIAFVGGDFAAPVPSST
jgi:hypothetical protein